MPLYLQQKMAELTIYSKDFTGLVQRIINNYLQYEHGIIITV